MHRAMILFLTLMLSGRAMTLAFVGRAGGDGVGDPPAAWLMPLVGDAVIGVSALAVAFLIWKQRGLWVWTTIIVWNSLAIWDALSAYLIHRTNPWPEFLMIQLFGASMFFSTAALHLGIILLTLQPDVKEWFLTDTPAKCNVADE